MMFEISLIFLSDNIILTNYSIKSYNMFNFDMFNFLIVTLLYNFLQKKPKPPIKLDIKKVCFNYLYNLNFLLLI